MTAGRAALRERGDDLYQSPPEAVHALLRAEQLPPVIWEPACGPGSIVRVLRDAGHTVVATDLVDYESADQDHARRDFLMEHRLPPGVEAILTNPPFKLASEFVARAIELCPTVIMLLRLAFLESQRRTAILDGGQLARVHVFKNRLPMMHRAGWAGNRVSNPTPFAWFVWDRNHHGPTELHRIEWEAAITKPQCRSPRDDI
ncbi:MAG: class I SAM-dependent methyltransferase [Bradyrhizobium sp.]|nr:class I SAM-dependent methyltransferase [Bradyrhizobium sp.]